ncbi:Predicted membrane protein [Franzmannia pantelleriensis]|uniref:Predicted membrane protein n=1 Tax=Franzmannia pantelleriensis TaxID=48727 RepID=A0A1G9PBK2_9GAMM|nr:DUF2157 domain-containing protein [Halomonas pantelleriensis]SDL95861.1 Predicted membrane protein [Halomonas pantelleriensis]
MASTRRELVALIEGGAIAREQVPRAVARSGLHPSGQAWGVFVDRLLLWLGTLALVCAMLFLVAYNWSEMPRWVRFGLVQAALVVAVATYCWGAQRRLVARAALTAASLLLGVLLALFGQVYQTGADPWQLFFFWALLMLPWTLVARFDALWILWLGLLNLSLALYFQSRGGPLGVLFVTDAAALWGVFTLNTTALVLWELGARRLPWLSAGWSTCLLALGSGTSLTMLVLAFLFDPRSPFSVAVLVYPAWLAVVYAVYRYWRADLFMLAGGCLSVIVVVTALIGRYFMRQGDPGGLLVLAIAVLGMGALAVIWLKRLQKEMLV